MVHVGPFLARPAKQKADVVPSLRKARLRLFEGPLDGELHVFQQPVYFPLIEVRGGVGQGGR